MSIPQLVLSTSCVDEFDIFTWFVITICLSLLNCDHHIIALGHLEAKDTSV